MAFLLSQATKTRHNVEKKEKYYNTRLWTCFYATTAVDGSEPPKPPKAPMPCAWTAGKEPAAHWTAHEQEPSALTVPVPVVRPLLPAVLPTEAVAVLVAAVPPSVAVRALPPAATAEVVVPVVPPAAVVPPLPVMALPVPVPFWAMANCWNMAWVLLAVGLMEKVMP